MACAWRPEDVAKDCHPEAFEWMSANQSATGFRSRRFFRHQRTSGASSTQDERSRTENYARLSELYAGEGDLYTSGGVVAAGEKPTGSEEETKGGDATRYQDAGVEMKNVRGSMGQIKEVTESKMPSSPSQLGTSGGAGDNNEGIHASVVVAVENPMSSGRQDSRRLLSSTTPSSSSSSAVAPGGTLTGDFPRPESFQAD